MTIDNEYFKLITEQKRQAVIIRSEIERFTNKFFFDKDFTFVEPPTLHDSIADKKVYEIYLPLYDGAYSLSSSNALFMGLYASEFNKVFTISKCFRDESDTKNHLVEFSVLEVEMLNCSLNEMIQLITDYIKFILDSLLTSHSLKRAPELLSRIKTLRDDFKPRIESYEDFVASLPQNAYDPLKNISSVDYFVSKYLKDIVFITDYPSRFASWTSKKKTEDTKYAINLLLPGTYGELCEGCERSINVDVLQEKIHLAKAERIQWYIDFQKNKKVNRAGFGLGVDRLIRWIIGADNIGDTKFFPRVKKVVEDQNV